MQLKIDLRFVTVALLIIIASMLAIWRPWIATDKRTISVTGQATVRQAPDEFIFYPTYTAAGDTSQAAVSKVSETGNAVVAKLKELGVAENQLKTDVNGSGGYPVPYAEDSSKPFFGSNSAYYTITATINDNSLAQKVLDYLVTTETTYAVTPQSSLSKDTRQKLETEARTAALVDARAKAVSTAESVGAKLGLVISVSELSGGGQIFAPADSVSSSPTLREETTTAPVLLVGEQDLDFSVQVVYQLR